MSDDGWLAERRGEAEYPDNAGSGDVHPTEVELELPDSPRRRQAGSAHVSISPDIDVCLRALGHRLIDEANHVRDQIYRDRGNEMDAIRRQTFQLTRFDPAAVAWADFEFQLQRLRRGLVPEGFADGPGWNILLDLFVQSANGRKVSVSDACIASLAPPTTALRYIGMLDQADLIRRAPDPMDRRRVFIALTESAQVLVRRYLVRATRSCPLRDIGASVRQDNVASSTRM